MADNLTTIRISKGDTAFTGRVPVGVNGQVSYVPIDKDTPVGDHILSALNDSGVNYTVVPPKGGTAGAASGVGAAPASEQAHTALQAEPVNEDIYEAREESDALKEPVRLGEGAAGSATGEQGDGTGFRTDGANAVETGGSTGGGTGGGTAPIEQGGGATGAGTAAEGGEALKPQPAADGRPNALGGEGGDGADKGGGTGDGDQSGEGGAESGAAGAAGGESGGEQTKAASTLSAADQKLIDGNLGDLTKGAAKIKDAGRIDALIAAEKSGKNRTGAISALEARKAALSA